MGRQKSQIFFFLFLLGIMLAAPVSAKRSGGRCPGNNCGGGGGWSTCSTGNCGGGGGWSTCSTGNCGGGGGWTSSCATCGTTGGISCASCGAGVSYQSAGTQYWDGRQWVLVNPANSGSSYGQPSTSIPQGFNPTQSSNGYRLMIDQGQDVPEGAHSYGRGSDGRTQYADSSGKIIPASGTSSKQRAEKESAPNPAEAEDWDPLIKKFKEVIGDPTKITGTNSVNGIANDLWSEHYKKAEEAKKKVLAIDASDVEGRKAEALKGLKELNAWVTERWNKLITQLKKKAVDLKDNRFLALAAGLKKGLKETNEAYDEAITSAPLDMQNEMACIPCNKAADAVSRGFEDFGYLTGKKGEDPDFNGYLARWKGKTYRLTIDHDSGQPAISESAEEAETDLDRGTHKDLLAKIKTYYEKADSTHLSSRDKETVAAFNRWLESKPQPEAPKYAGNDTGNGGTETKKKGARDIATSYSSSEPVTATSWPQIHAVIKDETDKGTNRPVMVIVTKRGGNTDCAYCNTLHSQLQSAARIQAMKEKMRIVYVDPRETRFANDISQYYGGYYSGGFVFDWNGSGYSTSRMLPANGGVVGEIDRYINNSYASR